MRTCIPNFSEAPSSWLNPPPLLISHLCSCGPPCLSGLLCSISACNLWGHPFANTCAPAEIFFSVSIGYFIYDLCQVVSYKYSMWQVFVAHHTVAAIPYIINNLGYRSAHTHLCLSLFLCVELVNPFTNATYYLELKKYPPGAWQAQVPIRADECSMRQGICIRYSSAHGRRWAGEPARRGKCLIRDIQGKKGHGPATAVHKMSLYLGHSETLIAHIA